MTCADVVASKLALDSSLTLIVSPSTAVVVSVPKSTSFFISIPLLVTTDTSVFIPDMTIAFDVYSIDK